MQSFKLETKKISPSTPAISIASGLPFRTGLPLSPSTPKHRGRILVVWAQSGTHDREAGLQRRPWTTVAPRSDDLNGDQPLLDEPTIRGTRGTMSMYSLDAGLAARRQYCLVHHDSASSKTRGFLLHDLHGDELLISKRLLLAESNLIAEKGHSGKCRAARSVAGNNASPERAR